MISISTGDIMHVMGSFGLHMDYTVRMKLRLTDVIDVLFPGRTKPLTNSYIINARPMIGAALTHHNCVQTVTFEYSDRVKAMPFDWQCTVHRGTTFVQAMPERVAGTLTFLANVHSLTAQSAPTICRKDMRRSASAERPFWVPGKQGPPHRILHLAIQDISGSSGCSQFRISESIQEISGIFQEFFSAQTRLFSVKQCEKITGRRASLASGRTI